MESKLIRRSVEVFIFGKWGVSQPHGPSFGVQWIRKKEIPRTSIRSVAAGECHVALLDGTGTVHVIGSNGEGQCGTPPSIEAFFPSPKAIVSIKAVTKVVCGAFHTALLTQAGSIYVCGRCVVLACERLVIKSLGVSENYAPL